MYNRYIPQPDGSYRRNRMQESQRPASPPGQQQSPPEAHANVHPSQEKDGVPLYQSNEQSAPRRRNTSTPTSAGSFLRRLLPGNLDTEDLLVVVLLLLMAGDCEEDRNTALLTLALYLFL
ncbi:MAG: hypothetical protein Q4F81_08370 [Eubacteriales bacterium]|nr:hypothetical protein [Eubacteriales bacterium]